MAALLTFHAWIWEGVDIGQFLIDLVVRDIFDTKITWSGSMPTSGWPSVSLHYNNGLNAVMD